MHVLDNIRDLLLSSSGVSGVDTYIVVHNPLLSPVGVVTHQVLHRIITAKANIYSLRAIVFVSKSLNTSAHDYK